MSIAALAIGAWLIVVLFAVCLFVAAGRADRTIDSWREDR